ncbi:MAG: hypothetical protein ACLQBB_05695 [Solirubrobacteraceae bacterium]
MADIQADGLRAASELLERVLDPAREAPGPSPGPPEYDYQQLLGAWAELLQRVAAGLARPVDPGTVTAPVDASGVGPPVRLALEESEGSDGAAAEVWLHNGTTSAVGPMSLRCGPLTASDGTPLAGADVRFEPGEVELLPPRSSRGVVVSLRVGGDPPRPGVYRGTIQADGAPKLWLPIEVSIQPC